MRRSTTANMCEINKYIYYINIIHKYILYHIISYYTILYYIILYHIINNIYLLTSHTFAVVLRRIAVFLLSNLFAKYHCKHPRIRRVIGIPCTFLFRFKIEASNQIKVVVSNKYFFQSKGVLHKTNFLLTILLLFLVRLCKLGVF